MSDRPDIQYDEEKATSVYEFTQVALRWFDEKGNSAAARSCMDRAENLASEPVDHYWIANVWLHVWDIEAGRQAVETYIDLPLDHTCSDLSFRAQLYGFLGESLKGHESAAAAEQYANFSEEWCLCAQGWYGLGNQAEATRCIERAESLAESSHAWGWCAKTLLTQSQPNEARACLELAEESAQSQSEYDWDLCKTLWQQIGDQQAVDRCHKHPRNAWQDMRDFESDRLRWHPQYATTIYNYLVYDLSWKDRWGPLVADEDQNGYALRTVDPEDTEAEILASIAVSWFELGETTQARRSLRLAEAAIGGIENRYFANEWHYCAAFWQRFGDLDEVHRCLKLAQEKAQHIESGFMSFWIESAEIWCLLQEPDEASYCVAQAVKNKGRSYLYLACAQICHYLDESEKAIASLQLAEKQANVEESLAERADWASFASLWIKLELLANADAALEKAEIQAAEYVYQWRRCANVWLEYAELEESGRRQGKASEFRGLESAARCFRQEELLAKD
ncbi:MAG: hypothetical protein GKR90_10635 [Pseudomonadales bacterium]|nr:hypothetical protein [Pseudomonadales bacterium]